MTLHLYDGIDAVRGIEHSAAAAQTVRRGTISGTADDELQTEFVHLLLIALVQCGHLKVIGVGAYDRVNDDKLVLVLVVIEQAQ